MAHVRSLDQVCKAAGVPVRRPRRQLPPAWRSAAPPSTQQLAGDAERAAAECEARECEVASADAAAEYVVAFTDANTAVEHARGASATHDDILAARAAMTLAREAEHTAENLAEAADAARDHSDALRTESQGRSEY